MRQLSAKAFIKILKGEDLEFQINPYSIKVKEPVVVENIRCRYTLRFFNSTFKSITMRNVQFSGNLTFEDCQVGSLTLEQSVIKGLTCASTQMKSLSLSENRQLGEVCLENSDFDSIEMNQNARFKSLHIGCKNNVLKAGIANNGFENDDSGDSKLYLCPDRFGEIDIHQLKSAKLEIGTFGEHSKLRVDGVEVDDFKLTNCKTSTSEVSLTNIKPAAKHRSLLHVEDSHLDEATLNQLGASGFKNASGQSPKSEKKSFWKNGALSLFFAW